MCACVYCIYTLCREATLHSLKVVGEEDAMISLLCPPVVEGEGEGVVVTIWELVQGVGTTWTRHDSLNPCSHCLRDSFWG